MSALSHSTSLRRCLSLSLQHAADFMIKSQRYNRRGMLHPEKRVSVGVTGVAV